MHRGACCCEIIDFFFSLAHKMKTAFLTMAEIAFSKNENSCINGEILSIDCYEHLKKKLFHL